MRRVPSRHRHAVLLVLFAAPSVSGTDRYFPDLSVLSADGRLRLEAKSPDNSGQYRRAFASNFDYTLYEGVTSRIVWSRKQSESEGSPVAAFVHQDGSVVVWTGRENLSVLNAQGAVSLKLHLLYEALPADDVNSYVLRTTAGPVWASYSHGYFFVVGEWQYFGMRTWWDRRIIVSLEPCEQVPDEGPVRDTAAASEREYVLTTLRKGAELARQWAARKLPEYSYLDKGPWHEVNGLTAAIHMAGRMGIKEAISLLHDIEKIPSFGSSISGGAKVPEGKLMVVTSSSDMTRKHVQLSLRRLGTRPAGYPASAMKLSGKGPVGGELYRPRKHTTPRAERVALVTPSMEPKEVVDVIGEPDYIVRTTLKFDEANWAWAWKYDIDAERPYTFRIVWRETGW